MKSFFTRVTQSLIVLGLAVACSRSTDFVYHMPDAPAPAKGKATGPGSLGGTVTDPSGQPLAYVAVHIASGASTANAYTDYSGHYNIADVKPGAYSVDFTLSGYSAANGVRITVVGDRSSLLNIVMTQNPGGLEGYVNDASTYRGIAGATVQIHTGDETTPIRASVQTDSNGHYSFAGLPSGTYAVDFSADGYVSVQGASATIYNAQQTRLDMTLTSVNGRLAGSVMDSTYGRYLPGVQITVHSGSPTGPVTATTQTDFSGSYAIGNLTAGAYYVDFSLSGYLPVNGVYAQILTGQTTTLNEDLASTAAGLMGYVTNALDGQPLSGVTVVLHNGASLQTTQTDNSGHYQFSGVTAGQATVDFSLSGYVPIVAAPVTLNSGQTASLNESMTPAVRQGEFRIVLSWTNSKPGAVRDVDSYLSIPGDSNYAIDYNNRNDGNGANLDHDTTTWVGPETVTITSMRQGTYVYYVNNYNDRCDSQALGNSEVVVRVYDSTGVIKTYNIPQGTGITYELFHIVNGQILDVNRYNNSLHVEPNPICER